MNYELGISPSEAKRRTKEESLVSINLINEDDSEFISLTENEKMVLFYLCRSAFWIDRIAYQLQNKHNLDFYHFIKTNADEGKQYYKDVLKLFLAQKSINSLDSNGDMINLAKGVSDPLGKNFYHFDIPVDEFHHILEDMLERGEIKEVADILSSRTVVELVDGKLIATDYVKYFKKEFHNCVDELINARRYCKDEEFGKFLNAQIKALGKADIWRDAIADKLWAKLKNSRIEYTITRECYEDELTTTIYSNDKLMAKLKANNIDINPKDSLGCRVGIVNKEGTAFLDKLEGLNDIASKLMPYRDEYSNDNGESSPNQVAVDVDLVAMTGDLGAYRAGITLAENLPNSDKLAIKLGGGRRNVYHRQVRNTKSSDLYKKLIADDFLKYYNLEACHWATIEHENTHSLGPKNLKALGEYASILEEFKADMGIYAFLDEYKTKGLFTDEQVKQIIVTELYSSFTKAKPVMSQAHRVRSIMITHRLLTDGGILFKDDKLSFDFDKVISTTKMMLKEVIRLQLDKSVAKAKEYVDQYFVWSDIHERIAEIIKANSKKLNGEVVAPLYNLAVKDLNL